MCVEVFKIMCMFSVVCVWINVLERRVGGKSCGLVVGGKLRTENGASMLILQCGMEVLNKSNG